MEKYLSKVRLLFEGIKMKIGIIILQYNEYKQTQDFISILKKMNWNNIEPKYIIVDNDSPDRSGKEITNVYKNDKSVKIIQADKNLGFAKGNNLGIKYAFKNINVDLAVVSNSDINIKDKNFFQKLRELYLSEDFAVCGPDIYSLSKEFHQSPLRQEHYSVTDLNNLTLEYKKKIKLLSILKPFKIYDFVWNLRRKLGMKSKALKGHNFKRKQYNVVLCGAFFVLSKKYYQAYPNGLFDKTFMYLEEDALAIQCEQKNLKVIYDPSISVIHYDGISTLHANKNRINKYLFELKNTIDSADNIKNWLININEK